MRPRPRHENNRDKEKTRRRFADGAGLSTGHGRKDMAMHETVSRFDDVKARVSLREYADAHLEHVRGGLMCPACGSGAGPNHTPAFSIYEGGTRFKCFSCGVGGDVFDLAGIVGGTEDKREQLEAVCAWAGIPMGNRQTRDELAAASDAKADGERAERTRTFAAGRESEHQLIGRARASMAEQIRAGHGPGLDYMQRRGFTSDEIERFGIGYDEVRCRVILPWSTRPDEYYHIDRDITGTASHKYEKPRRADVGAQPLYNPGALAGKAFFVVEGVLDALALMACGFPAVALAGTGSTEFVSAVSGRGYRGTVLAALDQDEAGRTAEEKLERQLAEAGVAVTPANVSQAGPDEDGEKHDPAGMFAEDRAAFESLAAGFYAAAVQRTDEADAARYSEAMRRLQVKDPADAVMGIYTLADCEEPVPTGLAGLDRALDGGMRRGLTVLGAVSSLGKTTLAVQIADHIAEAGRPVLFVTIEQSAREIVAKSLSRIMRQNTGGTAGTVSAQTLQSRVARAGFNDERRAALDDACCVYTDSIAPSMHILEGAEQPTVSDVAVVARMMAEHDGQPPVVFIDYLQLLAPERDNMTEKQATDRNVTMLRHLARDLRTPVFVISSLNRSSYSGSISLDSFKESGGIEYGADVLLGLQPYHMAEKLDEVGEAKRRAEANGIMKRMKGRAERACEVVVLKYRNGALPREGIPVTFTPVCCLFRDGVDEAGR